MQLSKQQKKWAIIGGSVIALVAVVNLPPVAAWLESSEIGSTIAGFVMLALLAGGYFLPTIVATILPSRPITICGNWCRCIG